MLFFISATENFRAPENCLHLYQHFLEKSRIQSVSCNDDALLASTGRGVCRMILAGDERWRVLVPEEAWTMPERHAQLHLF